VAARSRAAQAALLVFSIVPGWLVVAGVAWPWIAQLGDGTVQTAVCWLGSIVVLNIGKVFIPNEDLPEGEIRIPWISGVAEMLLVNRNYLEWRTSQSGLPLAAVLPFAWAPWFAAIAFWVFLAGHAVIAIFTG
jgi:hypothetical protein